MPARRKPQPADLAAFASSPNAHSAEREAEREPRTPFNIYATRQLADEVRALGYRLSAARGRRVSLSSLVDEALTDLLAKYAGR